MAGAATDTVTNCSGSATDPGSLPNAVQNAASGDAIGFSLSPPCSLITLSNTMEITKSVTILGPGSSALAVSGGGTTEVFNMESGTVGIVGISGLTIEDGTTVAGSDGTSAPDQNGGAGGNAGDGGGISNAGTLKLNSDVISGNSTGAGGNGGYGFSGSDRNGTGGNGGNGGNGAGIFNSGTLTLDSDAMTANATGPGGSGGGGDLTGGNGGTGGSGGGIYNTGSISIVAGSITDNTTGSGGSASSDAGAYGGNGGNGGDGAGFFNSGEVASTFGTLVDGNAAGSGSPGASAEGDSGSGGAGGNGGGLFSTATPAGLDLNSSTVSNNKAGNGGDGGGQNVSGDGGNGGAGGGIDESGGLMMENATVADNSAGSGGNGGGNDAVGGNGGDGGSGGGVAYGKVLTLSNETVVGNAVGAGGTAGSGSIQSGISGVSGVGGGLSGNPGPGTGGLDATIVAESVGGDCALSVPDEDYNIDDDGTCGFTSPSFSDSLTLDATLGPLANNGGYPTVALLPGSPAIDQVPHECPTQDERGARRVRPCDIGAYDTDGNPHIKKFKPAKGSVGKTVTIEGSSLQNATSVTFNGTPAVIVKDTLETQVKVTVPMGATTGPVSVTTVYGNVVSTKSFTVTKKKKK